MNKVRSLFSTKAVVANDDGLWPAASGRLASYAPLVNYMIFNDRPQWHSLSGMQSLFDWFNSNPIFYAVVMIKAREYANMRISVVNKRTNKEEPEWTRKDIPRKLYDKFNKPNVLQSRWEFFLQRKIFEEVAGNSFTYGNFSMGFGSNNNISNLIALWNVWPAQMQFKLAGQYFEATELDEVIKEWKFEAGKYIKTWLPNEILHKNKPNVNITDGLIFGRATAQSLVRPLSNIDMAYESRNVIMSNRGMRVILTSGKSDASGAIPLLQAEKDAVQESLKGYGMLEHQKQFFFSDMPLNAVPIDQDVMKLGLFEEIATDAMTVCNAFGVPEVLLKLYIKGATFENQEASVRRLYQGTLIPEAEDDMIALTSFLGLDDTDWKLVPSFAHVACLQESENKKEDTVKKKSERLLAELKAGAITTEEFRTQMGYGPMPEDTTEEAVGPEQEPAAEDVTAETE